MKDADDGLCSDPHVQAWLSVAMDVLGEDLESRIRPSPLLYGSDCSGLDAPQWALSLLLKQVWVWAVIWHLVQRHYSIIQLQRSVIGM